MISFTKWVPTLHMIPLAVDLDAAQKYGPFVRITPNQVSCAHPNAPFTIYAQGSASLPKTPFYRAFYVNGTPSLFSTQDRAGHSSKRRVLAHPFSYASVKQFEGWIRKSVAKMVLKLDQRAQKRGVGIRGEVINFESFLDPAPSNGRQRTARALPERKRAREPVEARLEVEAQERQIKVGSVSEKAEA